MDERFSEYPTSPLSPGDLEAALPEDYRIRLKQELRPGEPILWVGVGPEPKEQNSLRGPLITLAWCLVIGGGSVALFSSPIWIEDHRLSELFITIAVPDFSISIVASVITLVVLSFSVGKKRRKEWLPIGEYYALSPTHLITWTRSVSPAGIMVDSYDLTSFSRIARVEPEESMGDVLLYNAGESTKGSYGALTLLDVREVRRAEAIIRLAVEAHGTLVSQS